MMTDLFSSVQIDDIFTEFILEMEVYVFAAYCVNLFLVESVYACMGFGLYINSRVLLEGWDIELLFRNFTERGAKTLKVLPVLLLGLALVFPAGLSAQEAGVDAPLESLREVLASRDFGFTEENWEIGLKNGDDSGKEELRPLPPLEGLKEFSGQALRTVIIFAFAAILIFSLVRLYHYRKNRAGVEKPYRLSSAGKPPPQSAAGLLDKARSLHAEGKIRLAWAACLASAIAAYSGRGIGFSANETEYACLERARAAGAESAGEFAFLVGAWVAFAYAGHAPGEGDFPRALDFCRGLLEADHA
jgi:hypothetical protein